jgi:peptide chain release factor 1
MDFDLSELKKEYQEILQELANPEIISDWDNFENISRRKKKLENVIQKSDDLEKISKEEKENQTIIELDNDPELTSLAQSEMDILREKKINTEKELENLIKNLDEETSQGNKRGAVIIEIRAGAGGDEAALFAENLFRAYSRYAQIKNWKVKILDSNQNELGGYKEIVFELKSNQGGDESDVFSYMKYEGGVHRVQRVPETEKQGRIHTSTISVAVLPKPKKGNVKINPADLKIDTFKASGPGGQNVNKRETAIRITHLPTNIIVASQNERSLAQNKENAMVILEAKFIEMIEKKAEEKIKKERNEQVGTSDRSEKIRTYNYLQDRITDHRVKKNWHNIESILNGNLDSMIEFLKKELQ